MSHLGYLAAALRLVEHHGLRLPICVLGLLICALTWCNHAYGQGPDEIKQRFLDTAPRQWEEYRSFADGLDGTMTVSRDLDGKPYSHGAAEFKHNGNCRLVVTELSRDKGPKREVNSYNPAYAFRLARRDEQPWVVTELEIPRKKEDSQITREIEETTSALRVLVQLADMDLADLVRLPTFRVLDASTVTRDTADIVQVKFDNTHSMQEKGKPFCPIQGGEMILDPNRSWCLRAAKVHCKYGNADATLTVNTEFVNAEGKFPIPRRWVNRSDQVRAEGPLTMTTVMEFDVAQPSPVPGNGEFMLAAFGLPEPPASGIGSVPWYLYAAALGVLCLGLAGVLRWRSRRTEQVPASRLPS